MDYEDIFREELKRLDLSGIEAVLNDPLIPEEISDSINIKDILINMITGEELVSWDKVFYILKSLLLGELGNILILCAELMCICIVTGLMTNLSGSFGEKTLSKTGSVISSFMAAGVAITAFYDVYIMCGDTVRSMTSLMGASLPIVFSLTVISGGAASGTVMDTVISGAVTLFSAAVLKILMPAVFVSCVLVIINSLSSKNYVKKMSEFLRGFALFGVGFLITVFTGISAIQAMMTKSADSMLMNTARYSIDNFVPIIGGFTADSLEMVLTCIKNLKNGVGIAGVIILVLLLMSPLIKTLAIAAVFKFTAIMLEPMGDPKISDCMDNMGQAAVILASLLTLSSIMFIIFFAAVMKFSPV